MEERDSVLPTQAEIQQAPMITSDMLGKPDKQESELLDARLIYESLGRLVDKEITIQQALDRIHEIYNQQEIKLERINIDRIYHTQNNMPIRDMLLAVVKAQLQADQQVVDKLKAEINGLKQELKMCHDVVQNRDAEIVKKDEEITNRDKRIDDLKESCRIGTELADKGLAEISRLEAEKKEIANILDSSCPESGEQIYKCPRCVRQLRDSLRKDKIPKYLSSQKE